MPERGLRRPAPAQPRRVRGLPARPAGSAERGRVGRPVRPFLAAPSRRRVPGLPARAAVSGQNRGRSRRHRRVPGPPPGTAHMTAAAADAAAPPADAPALEYSVAPDTLVLPARITGGRGDGPRFADDVWDVTAFVPWTTKGSRIDFTTIADPGQRRTAKEFLHSRINRAVPVAGTAAKPMKITNLLAEFHEVRAILADLAA